MTPLDHFNTILHKRPLLVVIAASVVSLAIGLMASNQQVPRNQLPGLRPGFILVIPTSDLLDPSRTLRLKGEKVNLVRKGSDGSILCKIGHPPLSFNANERIVTLSGPYNDIEQFVTSVANEDLVSPNLISANDPSLNQCKRQIKIIYGDLQL